MAPKKLHELTHSWWFVANNHRPNRWMSIRQNFAVSAAQSEEGQSSKIPVPIGVAREYVVRGVGPDETLRSMTQCIYCGAKYKYFHTQTPLTEEHIIPCSIGGTKTILSASCQECMNLINDYEGKIISSLFRTPSKHLKIKNKKRKKSRKGHQARLFVGNDVRSYDLPLSDNPAFLSMPTYHLPRELHLNPVSVVDISGLWSQQANTDVDFDKIMGQGYTGLELGIIDTVAFSHFLCKLAHGFAVAKYGINWLENGSATIGEFEPVLLKYVRAKIPKVATSYDYSFLDFVGGLDGWYLSEDLLHGASVAIERFYPREFICVYLQLFANLGAPVYKIIAGRKYI